MTTTPTFPLEDEIGDVLEKAIHRAGLSEDEVATRAGVTQERLRDAIDYRGDLSGDELRRLSAVLALNEVGVCALGAGKYPVPEIGPLPFCVWPLRMRHGIGVANAYLVGECGAASALLFDTGAGIEALSAAWPATVRSVDAVFLTHAEQEHAGGLCDVVARFNVPAAFAPLGATVPCGRGIGEGESRQYGRLQVRAFSTPGHVAAHNCYLVEVPGSGRPGALLISGDLIFAGSAGGAYYSREELERNLRRILRAVPRDAVIAPGHGPLTTVENELRFNPFCSFA